MGIFNPHKALVWAAFNNFGIKICLKLWVSKYSCHCHISFSTFFFFEYVLPFCQKHFSSLSGDSYRSYSASGFPEAQTLPLKSFSFPKIFYSSQGWELILHHNLFVVVSLKLWCKHKSIMTDDETHWLLSFLCSNINIPGVCMYGLSL